MSSTPHSSQQNNSSPETSYSYSEEEFTNTVPNIPEAAEDILIFALEEAKKIFQEKAEVVPFTALLVGDQVLIETHPGDEVEICFEDARSTVEAATGAKSYAFCYDGFLDTEEGIQDALIAEGGIPASEEGYAVGIRYVLPDGRDTEGKARGNAEFESEVVYVGPAENYMSALPPFKEATE